MLTTAALLRRFFLLAIAVLAVAPGASAFAIADTAPRVAIGTPSDGATLNTIHVTGSANPGASSEVLVKLWAPGGALADVRTIAIAAPGGFFAADFEPSDGDGVYAVSVGQTGAGDQSAVDSVTFTVDRTAPGLGFDGVTGRPDAPTLSGVAGTGAGDLPVVHVQVTRDSGGPDVAIADAAVVAGRWRVDVDPLAPGRYLAHAQQYDSAGNQQSLVSAFVVPEPAPAPAKPATPGAGGAAVVPGPAAVLPVGGASAAPRTVVVPRLVVAFGRQRVRTILRRGLALTATCTPGCSAKVRLVLVLAHGRTRTLSSATVAGRRTLRLSASARRALRTARHPRLRILATAPGGVRLSRAVTLARR